jgi:hypothetical protein
MENALEHWVGEAYSALRDVGMTHDGMTGSAEEFEQEAKTVLGEMMKHYAQDAERD